MTRSVATLWHVLTQPYGTRYTRASKLSVLYGTCTVQMQKEFERVCVPGTRSPSSGFSHAFAFISDADDDEHERNFDFPIIQFDTKRRK